MSVRLYAILGGAAIVGGITWFALRQDDRADAPPAPTVAKAPAPEPVKTIAAPEHKAIAAPERPTIPTDERPRPELPTSAPATPQQLYAHERRDPDWGPRTEKEIEQKLAKLKGATLANTECHETECELTLDGDEHGLQVAIGELESRQNGLVEMADSIMLTAPSKRPDGSLQLRAYAKFSR